MLQIVLFVRPHLDSVADLAIVPWVPGRPPPPPWLNLVLRSIDDGPKLMEPLPGKKKSSALAHLSRFSIENRPIGMVGQALSSPK